jgi:hypothetical protein
VRAAALEAAASGQRVRHAEVKEKVALARRTVSMTEEKFKSTMAGMIGEAKRDLNSIAENLGLKASAGDTAPAAGDGWDEDRAMTRVQRVIVEELRCGGPTPPPYATKRFVDMLRLWADRLDRPVN